MKKVFLMAALAVAAMGANAQIEKGQIALKPMVGMTVANLTNTEDGSAKVGLAAGVEAEFGIADNFSITAGAIYSMQGAKSESSYDDGTDKVEENYKLNLDYINIPILANYYIVKGLAVKAGIQPAFNVRNKAKAEQTINGNTQSAERTIDGVKSFDFSIPVGVSYEFSNFVVDARYNIGCTKVFKGDDSDNKTRNSVFMFTVGYKFGL